MSDKVLQDPELDNESEDELGGSWPVDRLEPVLEALLFAAGDPIAVSKLSEIVEGSTRGEIRAGLKHLAQGYLTRGIRLVEVAGGWQMRTGPEHHRYVRKLFRERPFRMTRAATETMAVVAYKQPCTRGDVEAVRGVDCGPVLETLVERNLLRILGRKEGPGRPLLYGSTSEFLELFGLKSLRDLPTLAELGDEIESLADRGEFREGSSVDPAEVVPLDPADDPTVARTPGGEDAGPGDDGEAGRPGADEAGTQDAATTVASDDAAGSAGLRLVPDPGAAGPAEADDPASTEDPDLLSGDKDVEADAEVGEPKVTGD